MGEWEETREQIVNAHTAHGHRVSSVCGKYRIHFLSQHYKCNWSFPSPSLPPSPPLSPTHSRPPFTPFLHSPPLPSSLTQHLVGLPAPPDLVFQEQPQLLEGVSGRAHPLPHTLLCLPVGREGGEEGEGWAQATGEELNVVGRPVRVFITIEMKLHC